MFRLVVESKHDNIPDVVLSLTVHSKSCVLHVTSLKHCALFTKLSFTAAHVCVCLYNDKAYADWNYLMLQGSRIFVLLQLGKKKKVEWLWNAYEACDTAQRVK